MRRGLDSVAGRRLLLLNWRDHDHPRAGGAEVYTEQVARRLAAAGAHVTLFTARHPGSAPDGRRDGFDVVRQGGTLGVYLRAALFMLRRRGQFDAVVDFQNGIPFFAPLFAGRGTAVVLLIHHVHQEQFVLHFPWPASRVGQWLEGPVSRWVYRRNPLVAVSPSTRRDVRKRLRLRGPVHVVPNGLTPAGPDLERSPSPFPHVVVVSRLVSHKRFELLLDAVARLRPSLPDLEVDVVGDGPEREALERLATDLGLQQHVRFHGFAPAETRDRLLASAWLTVSPSQAEGWGLTVVEANAVGVPAVGFDVPGLRDSVVPGVTGWLVPEGGDLAEAVRHALGVLADPTTAAGFSERCRAWAARFSWDATAQRLAGITAGEVDRVRQRPRTRRLPTDLATRVDLRLADERAGTDEVEHFLAARVRRSDQHVVDDGRVRLILHGCDEVGAEAVLARLDPADVERLGLATTAELLAGVAE